MRPREFKLPKSDITVSVENDGGYDPGKYSFKKVAGPVICIGDTWLKINEARRLASWLIKAADWADAQGARRKGKGE